jgi:hypothetical protein
MRRGVQEATGSEKGVEIVATRGTSGRRRASFRGAVYCKSAYACPVCMYRRRFAASADLKRVVAEWRVTGGAVYMLTLTIRHRRGHRLRKQVELLRAAWRAFIHSRTFKRIAKDLGIAHLMHSTETTHLEASGWHPHIHALLLTRFDLGSVQRLEGAIGVLRHQWLLAVEKATATVCLPERVRAQYLPGVRDGAKLTKSVGTGDYLVKLGLHEAPSASPTRQKGRSPWAIMVSAASGDDAARALWKEYTAGMRGQHLVHGLGDIIKAIAPAARPVMPLRRPETVVALIPARIYRSISRIPGALPRVLHGAETQGLRGVAISVAADLLGVIARDPVRPPPEVHRLIRLCNPMGKCAHPCTWLPGGQTGGPTLRHLRRSREIVVALARRRWAGRAMARELRAAA